MPRPTRQTLQQSASCHSGNCICRRRFRRHKRRRSRRRRRCCCRVYTLHLFYKVHIVDLLTNLLILSLSMSTPHEFVCHCPILLCPIQSCNFSAAHATTLNTTYMYFQCTEHWPMKLQNGHKGKKAPTCVQKLNAQWPTHSIGYKSPQPLTDPRDAVPQAHRVVHTCRRSVW